MLLLQSLHIFIYYHWYNLILFLLFNFLFPIFYAFPSFPPLVEFFLYSVLSSLLHLQFRDFIYPIYGLLTCMSDRVKLVSVSAIIPNNIRGALI